MRNDLYGDPSSRPLSGTGMPSSPARTKPIILTGIATALCVSGLTVASPLATAAQDVAIVGGTVVPVSSPPVPNGTVLIQDGRITAVGADVPLPEGVTTVDASGRWVLPGLVDAMSYYGIAAPDLNETGSPSTPHLRALEAYYPFGAFGDGEPPAPPRARDLLMGGVTAHYIAPGDATVIGGQGAVVKAAGPTFDDLVLLEPAAMDITLGDRPAATMREAQRSPGTRMAVVGLLRQELVAAREYREQWSRWESAPEVDRGPPPARDLGKEALTAMLRGDIPARIQANRITEIRAALELSREFGFRLIVDSGISAHQMAEELAAAGVPVVLGPISHPWISGEEIPDRGEYPNPDERRAARLLEAGVDIAIASFARSFGTLGPEGSGKWLLLDAALAAAHGLDEADVLRAITLTPAEILGVADRLGSLEPGKDGDVVILDGPPLSIRTWVERVFVDGVEVFVRQEAASPP